MKFDLNDFHKKYKWSATYNETNSLVSLFLNSLSNKELMSHIKFNNDYERIKKISQNGIPLIIVDEDKPTIEKINFSKENK